MLSRFVIIIAAAVIFAAPAFSRDNPYTLYKKGAELAAQGDIDGAIAIFKPLAESNPNYSLAHYGLGKAYLKKSGMLEEAVKELKIAVTLDKRFSKGYFYLGLAYQLSDKYNLAIKAYKDSFAYSSTQIEALYNIGAVYEITGRYYYSKIYFNRYLKLKKKDESEIIF